MPQRKNNMNISRQEMGNGGGGETEGSRGNGEMRMLSLLRVRRGVESTGNLPIFIPKFLLGQAFVLHNSITLSSRDNSVIVKNNSIHTLQPGSTTKRSEPYNRVNDGKQNKNYIGAAWCHLTVCLISRRIKAFCFVSRNPCAYKVK